MTSEVTSPKEAIRIDIVQKQYKNGMQLDELARLYEVDKSVLRPVVDGIVQKSRKVEDRRVAVGKKGQLKHLKKLEGYSREQLREIVETHHMLTPIAAQLEVSKDTAKIVLKKHGLDHLILTRRELRDKRYRHVIMLDKQGLNCQQIMQRLGMAHDTYMKALQWGKREQGEA